MGNLSPTLAHVGTAPAEGRQSSALRRPRWVVAALALSLAVAAAAAGCSSPSHKEKRASQAPPESPPLRLGQNLLQYISLAGDQAVVVPNGTYTPGTVTAP